MKKSRPIKAIGRKRRTLGWTLLTLDLLVAAVWVASGWWWTSWSSGHWFIDVYEGQVRVYRFDNHSKDQPLDFQRIYADDAPRVRWRADNQPRHHQFPLKTVDLGVAVYLSGEGDSGPFQRFDAVLWPLPLSLITSVAMLLRSSILARRRANTGMCAKCGYSLAGLASDAPCPECGKGAA